MCHTFRAQPSFWVVCIASCWVTVQWFPPLLPAWQVCPYPRSHLPWSFIRKSEFHAGMGFSCTTSHPRWLFHHVTASCTVAQASSCLGKTGRFGSCKKHNFSNLIHKMMNLSIPKIYRWGFPRQHVGPSWNFGGLSWRLAFSRDFGPPQKQYTLKGKCSWPSRTVVLLSNSLYNLKSIL